MESVLYDRSLVLNRNWVAITTCTVHRAFSLLYQGLARAVAPETFSVHDFPSWTDLRVAEGEPCIRTITLRIKVPEIILLLAYDRIPEKTVVFSRRNLFRRDGYLCQYCGTRPPMDELSIDHVIPRAEGGRSTWENCVVACIACNKRKGNRRTREAGMRLVRAPIRPAWKPSLAFHFGHRKVAWEKFVSEKYWNTELEP